MASECPSCGEVAVVWEEYAQQVTDGKPQQVCTECGLILEEGCYTSFDAQGTSDVKFNRHLYESSLPSDYLRRNRTDRESKAKKIYEKGIERLGTLFDLPSDIVERSKELFGIVYKSNGFHSVAVDNKTIIAGCCLFAVCRLKNMPMLFKFFANALNCTKDKFSKELKRLVDITEIRIPSLDISEYVEGFCRKLEVSDGVKTTTFDIIEVAKSTWISQGRQTEHLLSAAVYIAWVAEDPTKRLKTSLHKFLQKHDTGYCKSKVTQLRYTELTEVLCKLAKAIPWVDVKCANLKTAVFNLKDIISYQESLIYEASSRVSHQLSEELKEFEEGEEPKIVSPPSTPQDTDATIIARHLSTNTKTTTELSLVATVTEHTNVSKLKESEKQCTDTGATDSDASSEEGHRYSLILSPGKEQTRSEILNESGEVSTSQSENVEEGSSASSSISSTSIRGIERQKSITEGTVFLDKKGYNTLKALPSTSSKSDMRNSKDKSVCTAKDSRGELKSSRLTESVERENSQSNDTENKDVDKSFDATPKTSHSKRKRSGSALQLECKDILPKSFIIARQVSKETKKLKGDTQTNEDIKARAVSDQEIDADVEQYIRTEDEVNFIKSISSKKF